MNLIQSVYQTRWSAFTIFLKMLGMQLNYLSLPLMSSGNTISKIPTIKILIKKKTYKTGSINMLS